MQSVRRQLSGLFFVVAMVGAAGAATAPPSDEHVEEVIDAFEVKWAELFTGGPAKPAQVLAVRATALGDLQIQELTPRQIGMLYRANMISTPGHSAAAAERSETFLDNPSSAGATARVLRMMLVGGVTGPGQRPDAELQKELLGAVFAHDALHEAVRSGEAGVIIHAIQSLNNRSAWEAYHDEIIALHSPILASRDYQIAFDFETYFDLLGYVCTDEEESLRQNIRARMVTAGMDVQRRIADGGLEVQERYREFLDSMLARLDSAHAKGILIGSQAPALEFIWSNDESLTSLEALKGNVVILDFWATWCGPCVASIPNVRELQEHYEGYPVKIIGVTSVQGSHFGDGGVVDCKNDPDKEFALMAEYIGQKDMTWSIAFAKQEVYNPDYGVGGIPHVAILDPGGNVRYNGLHPANPLTDKATKINGLLKEFDLPAPPLPSAENTGSD